VTRPSASVIISSYNYGRFLRDAVDSVLAQTIPVEIIVVDDGSSDDSPQIIRSYGTQVTPVFKNNGGMASAWNAGFARSQAEAVLFLDADDYLLPTALEAAVVRMAESDAIKVHWPVFEVDTQGSVIGRMPAQDLPEGDFRAEVLQLGPDAIISPPIHGNLWARRFLLDVFPMPEAEFRRHSDTYLYTLAPAAGRVAAIPTPLSCYRKHGANDYACQSAEAKNSRNREMFEHRCRILSAYLARDGVQIAPATWHRQNAYYGWMQQLESAFREIRSYVPSGAAFVLLDDASWGLGETGEGLVEGRRAIPFPERGGRYWGPPPDEATAVSEMERMRGQGAGYVVVGWPAFWWLDHYRQLDAYLSTNCRLLIQNDRLAIWAFR
jgi:glycosyltransferase involved in cell wall biosynthesis